jgi:hypothetical protein
MRTAGRYKIDGIVNKVKSLIWIIEQDFELIPSRRFTVPVFMKNPERDKLHAPKDCSTETVYGPGAVGCSLVFDAEVVESF